MRQSSLKHHVQRFRRAPQLRSLLSSSAADSLSGVTTGLTFKERLKEQDGNGGGDLLPATQALDTVCR